MKDPRKIRRIQALDGIRGLLALHIVFGHFLRFANPPKVWWHFFAQVNVTVGAFFALSGYFTAYTCTVVGERATCGSFRTMRWQEWWLSKAMTVYPMHWIVLLVFGPAFVYSDCSAAVSLAKRLSISIRNGLLSVTLTQAWWPMHHAEIWNAPTWFLSSLLFCNLVLALSLPTIAKLGKRDLRMASMGLYCVNLLPVLCYFWIVGNNSWRVVEGTTRPRDHPSLEWFNVVRFFPVFNAAETILGALACRLVMLERTPPRLHQPTIQTTVSVFLPWIVLLGILVGRALDWIPDCSDLLIRKCIVIPCFLNLVMALHRSALLRANDPISMLLTTKPLLWLGNLSFAIYVLHGPIGQIFYKRAIANKLWGGVLFGPGYFSLYLATLLSASMLLQGFVVHWKIVGVAKDKLSKWQAGS